jgi:Protein of unknown function (DUF3800)
MLIYIDEAGRFTSGDGLSVVCALTLPHKEAGPCRRELIRLTKDWPRRDGELKAAELDTRPVVALVDVLYRHDALLHAVATDAAKHGQGAILRHQENQAEGITRHLTDDHLPTLVESVWKLRTALEKMPEQLYLQCVAMHQLVWSVAEETAMYFSQRRPTELAKFEWFVDAKDPTRITSQEKWWRDVIGPLGESRTRREPFVTVHDDGFDYRHFDRAFSMEKDMGYPNGPRQNASGIDIKKLISNHISFVDSKNDFFIQVADILTGCMRRALRARRVERKILLTLGRLMIGRKRQGVARTVQIVTLDEGQQAAPEHLSARVQTIASTRRSMLKPRRALATRVS